MYYTSTPSTHKVRSDTQVLQTLLIGDSWSNAWGPRRARAVPWPAPRAIAWTSRDAKLSARSRPGAAPTQRALARGACVVTTPRCRLYPTPAAKSRFQGIDYEEVDLSEGPWARRQMLQGRGASIM